jgi:hypothetical protein
VVSTKYEARRVMPAEAEADVLRLLESRKVRSSEAIFRWLYTKSPSGPTHCFLLRAKDGDESRVVGMVGIVTRRVVCGARSLDAGLLGDFYVDPMHRTFFPAVTMQRAVLAWGRKELDLLYGFPNEAAAPLMEKLGYKTLATVERWVLVLRHRRYLASQIGSPKLARVAAFPLDAYRRLVRPGSSRRPWPGLALERVDTTDERFDRLFASRALADIATGERTAALLRWRFLERPDEESSIFALTDKTTRAIRAYAVVHVANENAHVRDLLGDDVETMGEALRLVAGAVRRRGCVALSFRCAAPPALRFLLERQGFRIRPPQRRLIGWFGDGQEPLHHWYATDADEDQ